MIRPPPHAFALPVTVRSQLPPRASNERSGLARGALWLGVGAVSAAVHLSAYYALTNAGLAPPPLPPPAPPAVMINLSPIAVSAKSTVDNATPTPPADMSEQAETPPEEAVEPPPAEEPMPELPPPPPLVNSEAVLAPPPPKQQERKEKAPEKPKLEKPKPKPKPRPKPNKPKKPVEDRKASVASRSGGGPKSDTGQAAVAAASAAGTAASEVSRASWLGDVRGQIVRNKRYPAEARSLGETGTARVAITIGPSGNAASVRLLGSSGSSSIDQEAVAVIYRAAPFPPPPGNKTTVLNVPINFNRR